MGFVEGEAMSCAAELLLSCQYRVATPFANILFHYGHRENEISQLMDPDLASFILDNIRAKEKLRIERFCRVTGQTMEMARIIYRADDIMPTSRAIELGVLHEVTDEFFRVSPRELFKK